MQRLFTTARWDANLVRDDVRGFDTDALGDPDGVLIGDVCRAERPAPAAVGEPPASTDSQLMSTVIEIRRMRPYHGQG